MPHVDALCTVFNGKSTTLPTFSEQINLLKAAWCHLKKKKVLSLLPLGLPQEFAFENDQIPSFTPPPPHHPDPTL